MQPYQGITPISGGSLSSCAETYFAQSEQLPTRIVLFSNAKQSATQIAKASAKAGATTAGVVGTLDKAFKKGHQLYLGKTDAEMEAAEMMGKMIQNYEKTYGKSIGDSMDAAFSS